MPHLAFYMHVGPTDLKSTWSGLIGSEIEMDWTDMFHVFQTDRLEPRTSSSPSRSEIGRSRSILVRSGRGLSVWSDLAADMEVGQTTLDDYDNDSIVDKVLKFFISSNVEYKMNHLHVNERKCLLQTLSTSHEPSHEPSRAEPQTWLALLGSKNWLAARPARLVANPGKYAIE